MPLPRPLTPQQAKHTLANKFVGLGDRLRQLNTRFGIRSNRVFLVWTSSDGEERGEGSTRVLLRHEILPTPKVADMSAVALSPYAPGVLPVGSVRVSQITQTLTKDVLVGVRMPYGQAVDDTGPMNFWWEIVEDGRGDDPPERWRFRLAAQPDRQPGSVQWVVLLERQSSDPDRTGALHGDPSP